VAGLQATHEHAKKTRASARGKGRALSGALIHSVTFETMPREEDPGTDGWISPIGHTIDEFIAEREAEDPELKTEREENRHLREFAKLVLIRRTELVLDQRAVAERMGTSHSVISRLESGRHSFSIATLRRLADALDMNLVFGLELKDGNAASESALIRV
jgi:DNA-binding transcriptional regulator YiaG